MAASRIDSLLADASSLWPRCGGPPESPLRELFALQLGLLSVTRETALHTGATIVTLPKFEPELFLQTMAAREVSLAYLVPPIVLFLAKHPAARAVPLPKLRSIFSGAAPLDAETQLDVTRALGGPPTQAAIRFAQRFRAGEFGTVLLDAPEPTESPRPLRIQRDRPIAYMNDRALALGSGV